MNWEQGDTRFGAETPQHRPIEPSESEELDEDLDPDLDDEDDEDDEEDDLEDEDEEETLGASLPVPGREDWDDH